MDFHKKISFYFEKRGISNKEISKAVGYSETMISRYLNSNKPNYDFIKKIVDAYPDIDLNYLFKDDTDIVVNEDAQIYESAPLIIRNIEEKLTRLKQILAQKSHE